MEDDTNRALVDWLFGNAGPIIRWRLVTDFGLPVGKKEVAELRKALLATDEVKRWLGNLRNGAIHGSKDINAENAMAKLVEYGLRAGIPDFDEKMLPYVQRNDPVADAFLVAAGYHEQGALADRFRQRLARLHDTAIRGDYDFYLPRSQADRVPKAWRGKPIYRPEFDVDTLPSCYDFYAMAHWPGRSEKDRRRIEDVVAYISHDDFQNTLGGYLWDRDKNVCHAAGRVWLACLTPQRLVLFLELAARFAPAHRSKWFRQALAGLEQHRTEQGTYRLPLECLKEKRNSYYIYQGAHMGLGENRRRRSWLELESTFRMLNIKRLMKK